MSDREARKEFEIKRFFSIWLISIGAVCLIGILLSKELVVFLIPVSYHEAHSIIPIIIFGYFVNGLYYFAVQPIFYFNKTIYLPFLTFASASVNIIVNMILIPLYGIYGAAYATVISFIFQAVLVYIISKKLFDPEYEHIKIIASIGYVLLILVFMNIIKLDIGIQFLKIFAIFIFLAINTSLFFKYFKPLK
jgi:O-antigen/teichoic acid export membrane protein